MQSLFLFGGGKALPHLFFEHFTSVHNRPVHCITDHVHIRPVHNRP